MRVTVEFIGGLVEHQEIGTAVGDVLSARLDYRLVLPDRVEGPLSSRFKLTAGGDYHDGIVEVVPPEGYSGPWNQHAFTECARDYFLGRLVHVERGARLRLVMVNTYLGVEARCYFDVERE